MTHGVAHCPLTGKGSAMQLHIRRDRCRHARCHCYSVRLLALFSDEETAVVDANAWWQKDLYQSQQMLDLLERHDAIADTPIVPLDPDLPFAETLFKAGPFEQLLWKGAKLLINSARLGRAHHITVADLTDGVELSGTLDEITTTEAIIVNSLEILDAKLCAARTFHGGASIVPIGSAARALPPPQTRPRRLS